MSFNTQCMVKFCCFLSTAGFQNSRREIWKIEKQTLFIQRTCILIKGFYLVSKQYVYRARSTWTKLSDLLKGNRNLFTANVNSFGTVLLYHSIRLKHFKLALSGFYIEQSFRLMPFLIRCVSPCVSGCHNSCHFSVSATCVRVNRILGVRVKKVEVLLYLYTLRPFSLSPLDIYPISFSVLENEKLVPLYVIVLLLSLKSVFFIFDYLKYHHALQNVYLEIKKKLKFLYISSYIFVSFLWSLPSINFLSLNYWFVSDSALSSSRLFFVALFLPFTSRFTFITPSSLDIFSFFSLHLLTCLHTFHLSLPLPLTCLHTFSLSLSSSHFFFIILVIILYCSIPLSDISLYIFLFFYLLIGLLLLYSNFFFKLYKLSLLPGWNPKWLASATSIGPDKSAHPCCLNRVLTMKSL